MEKTFTTNLVSVLSTEYNIKPWQAENTIALLDEGATIPFIARYRKEKTGELDDRTIRSISEKIKYVRGLDEKKQSIYDAILSQEKMNDEIALAIENANTLSEIEDIYRPYRPKRKTRASIAKEKGLEPLAMIILMQDKKTDILQEAKKLLSDDIATTDDAIDGAKDIIAEIISDDSEIRSALRDLYLKTGTLNSKGDENVESVYTQYYNFSQLVSKIAQHRVLAVNRGEKEGFLKVSVDVDTVSAIKVISKKYITANNECSKILESAILDAYTRLIHPSLENEIRNTLTDTANEGAIKLFGDNLKQLLLQPPVKGKICMALDPGYRTGCKMAVVDATGKVIDNGVVYMTLPNHDKEKAKKYLLNTIQKNKVDIISIGNGTATKETEMVVADMIRENSLAVSYRVVSEAGASVYSASKLAQKEFPEFDVTIRSAVSIARRLQDPLAELVKIDPKSIGVGQYQHDMPQKKLDESLDGVVEYCVNSVGVDLNTASAPLLERVSGLNKTTAKNIVDYREENGEFTNRKQLLKVAKIGPKAYTLCAGFLKIPNGAEILDSSSVHPESYETAKIILSQTGYSENDIGTDRLKNLNQDIEKIGYDKLSEITGTGIPTLKDIVSELVKPGRDMRDDLPSPILRTDVLSMDDLCEGMQFKGTVRNVIDFGAFVDIGVHQDGLVHISQISDKFIKHPSDVLKVGDIIDVWILSVDKVKKKISLTMKNPNK